MKLLCFGKQLTTHGSLLHIQGYALSIVFSMFQTCQLIFEQPLTKTSHNSFSYDLYNTAIHFNIGKRRNHIYWDLCFIHCFSMFQMCQLISEQPLRERPEFVTEGRRRFSGGPHFLTEGGGLITVWPVARQLVVSFFCIALDKYFLHCAFENMI